MYIGTNFIPTAERGSKITNLIDGGVNPLDCFVNAELDYVELSLRDDTLDSESLVQDIQDLHSVGVQVNMHPYYESRGFGTPSEKSFLRPNMERVLAIARDIAQHEGRRVLLNFHAASGRDNRSRLLKDSYAFNEWLIETAENLGADVTITTEHQLPPSPRQDYHRIGDNFPELLDMQAHQPHEQFGLCWDMGHSMMRHAYYDVPMFPPDEFLPLVKHVHIHDVTLAKPLDHRPIGEGDSPLSEFVISLVRAGYSGGFTMEYQVVEFFGETYTDFLRRSRENLLQLAGLRTA